MAATDRRFVKKIPSSGVGPAFKLSLPHKFVHMHFDDLVGKTFELAASAVTDKFWHASITPRRNRDRQEFCLRGWKLFAEAHTVQAGDQFAFELVRPNRLVISLLTRAKDNEHIQPDLDRVPECSSPCESPRAELADPYAAAFPMNGPSLQDLGEALMQGDALADGDDLAAWLDGGGPGTPNAMSRPFLKLGSQGGLSQAHSSNVSLSDEHQGSPKQQPTTTFKQEAFGLAADLPNEDSMLPLLKGILSDEEEDGGDVDISTISRSSTILSGMDAAADPVLQLTSRTSSHGSGMATTTHEAEHKMHLAPPGRQGRCEQQPQSQLHQHHSGMSGNKRPCAASWAEGYADKHDISLGYTRAKRQVDHRGLARHYSEPNVSDDSRVDEEVQQLSGTIRNLQDDANRCQLQALKAQEQQAKLKVFLAESRDCLQSTQQATFLLENLAAALIAGCNEAAPAAIKHAMQSTQTEMASSMSAIRSGIQGFLGIRV